MLYWLSLLQCKLVRLHLYMTLIYSYSLLTEYNCKCACMYYRHVWIDKMTKRNKYSYKINNSPLETNPTYSITSIY